MNVSFNYGSEPGLWKVILNSLGVKKYEVKMFFNFSFFNKIIFFFLGICAFFIMRTQQNIKLTFRGLVHYFFSGFIF